MSFDPREADSQPPTQIAPASLPTSGDGAGRKGRAPRSIAAGSGRPQGYTDDECQQWWLRFIAGESTFEISKALMIDQVTIIQGIKYIALTVDSPENVQLAKTQIVDYNRSLRLALQQRLSESIANLQVLDALLRQLAPTPALAVNMGGEQKKEFQSLLASRQYEIQSQLRITAEIRAAQKDYAALVGVATKPKPVGKGTGKGDEKPEPDNQLQYLVGELSELPEDELEAYE